METYIIIEMQTNGDTTNVVTPVVKTNFFEAEQEYHLKLSYAAVSNVEIHSVTMLNAKGNKVESKYFDHRTPEVAEE